MAGRLSDSPRYGLYSQTWMYRVKISFSYLRHWQAAAVVPSCTEPSAFKAIRIPMQLPARRPGCKLAALASLCNKACQGTVTVYVSYSRNLNVRCYCSESIQSHPLSRARTVLQSFLCGAYICGKRALNILKPRNSHCPYVHCRYPNESRQCSTEAGGYCSH